MRSYFKLTLAATVAALGCSVWRSQEPQGVPRLPHTRMSSDSVGIEIATVTLDANNAHLWHEIRQELDEQVLSPERRRRLTQNGLIGGFIGTQLPAPLSLLLLEASDRREHPTPDSFWDIPDQQRFVQCRANQRVGVGLWMGQDRLEIRHDDGELAVSDTFLHPACQMAIHCSQGAAGTAVVRLTPEIEHGPMRQQYVADGGGLHVATRRERKVYDDLEMKIKLRPGEILLVTCSDAPGLVGSSVFRNADSTKQKLLLIRLAQTQVDISFGDADE